MEISSTQSIVDSITKSIVEHRIEPGSKLVEQKLADHYGVSRTLVRQALYQLQSLRLVVIEPARGAFVASPSVQEARDVFEVRRMLEAEMTRRFCEVASDAHIQALREHVQQEKLAIDSGDTPSRIELLGDFHVRMAELMGNAVLADTLSELISRCSLITLIYQSTHAAQESNEEHVAIVEALSARNAGKAVKLMDAHLQAVVKNMRLDAAR
jgi:DNA-binding GntR family transcriptional regulator